MTINLYQAEKTKTARYFDMITGIIGSLSHPGGSLFKIEPSNGRSISFPGGIPIKNSIGNIIGAIGVSGSTVDNNHTIAESGIAVL